MSRDTSLATGHEQVGPTPRRRGRWLIRLAACLGAVGLGLALGTFVVQSRRSIAPHVAVSLKPALLDYTDRRFLDGETLQAEFTLKNLSATSVTVRDLLTSCTCSSALPNGQSQPPFDLAPGQEVVCSLVSNLKSRLGRQSFELTVETESDGILLPRATGRVELIVDSGLTPFPASIDAGFAPAGQTITKRIILGDTLKKNDIAVTGVKVSDPSLMEAAYENDASVVQRAVDFTVRGRYAIDLILRPDGSTSVHREVVDILLSDGTEIRVPVVFGAELDHEVTPPRVYFGGVLPVERVERAFLVRLTRADADRLRVVATPSGIKVEIEPFGRSQWRVKLTGVMPDSTAADKRELRLAAGDSSEPILVPIEFQSD